MQAEYGQGVTALRYESCAGVNRNTLRKTSLFLNIIYIDKAYYMKYNI